MGINYPFPRASGFSARQSKRREELRLTDNTSTGPVSIKPFPIRSLLARCTFTMMLDYLEHPCRNFKTDHEAINCRGEVSFMWRIWLILAYSGTFVTLPTYSQ